MAKENGLKCREGAALHCPDLNKVITLICQIERSNDLINVPVLDAFL